MNGQLNFLDLDGVDGMDHRAHKMETPKLRILIRNCLNASDWIFRIRFELSSLSHMCQSKVILNTPCVVLNGCKWVSDYPIIRKFQP